jgi:hypothetical protein
VAVCAVHKSRRNHLLLSLADTEWRKARRGRTKVFSRMTATFCHARRKSDFFHLGALHLTLTPVSALMNFALDNPRADPFDL